MDAASWLSISFEEGGRSVPSTDRESLLSKVAHHAFGKLPAAGLVEDATDNVYIGRVEDPLEVDFSQPALDRNVGVLDGVRQWKQLFLVQYLVAGLRPMPKLVQIILYLSSKADS